MSITIPATGPGTIVPAVATESHGVAGHFQLVKLADGNVGSLSPVGTSANPLNVYQPGIQTIIGSIGVTQISGPWSVVGSVLSTVFANSPFLMEGDTFHSSADPIGSNPVKIGGYAVTSAFPTAVNCGARVNAIFDRSGRQIIQNFAPATLRQTKWNTFTGPLSGTVVWSPGVNNRIAVTDIKVVAGSATAGIVGLFFARSGAPINITVGSGTALFYGEMAPSATAKPGALMAYTYPEVSDPNDALRISLSSAIQVYINVGGFEIP